MAPRKRQRNNKACSPLAAPPTLPADLLLDIVARSDARTLVRCSAVCRLLRCSILNTAFIQQQVSAGVVPQCVLARLHTRRHKRRYHRPKPLVSLVYPATPAASSFVSKHLAPFVSRRAVDLLRQYEPVMTRRGLVVLRRRDDLKSWKTSGSDLCVYDPMTDARTFLSEPPDISMDHDICSARSCVLLTAADGIGCFSFLLLVAKMSTRLPCRLDEARTMTVQTTTPSDAGDISWGPVTESVCRSGPFLGHRGLVVLPGGFIHWITRDQNILTYDVRTGKLGTVKHPDPHMAAEHHLAMSPDGRLRIISLQGSMISVWEQLSAGSWLRAATVDTEEKLQLMYPDIISPRPVSLQLRCSKEIRSNAILLQIHNDRQVVLLDLETKEMRKQEDSPSSFVFQVDLPARLQATRICS